MSCVVVWCVWWDTAFINIGSNFPFKDQADMASVATEPQASINIEFALNSEHKRIEKDETLCMYVLHTTLLPDERSASQAPLTVEITNMNYNLPGYPVKVRIVPAFSDKLLADFSAGCCYDGVVGHGHPKDDGTIDIIVNDNIKSFEALTESSDRELNDSIRTVSELLDQYNKTYQELVHNGSDGPLKQAILGMLTEKKDSTTILLAIQDTLETMPDSESNDVSDVWFCNTFVHVVTLVSVKELLNTAIQHWNASKSQGNDEYEYKNLRGKDKKQHKGPENLKARSESAKRQRLIATTSAMKAYKRYLDASKISRKPSLWWAREAFMISAGRTIEASGFQKQYNNDLRYERFDVWVPDEEADIKYGVEKWWSTDKKDVEGMMNFNKRDKYGFFDKMRGDSTAWTHNTNKLNPPLYKFVVEYLNKWGQPKLVDVLLDGKELHFRINKTGNQSAGRLNMREYKSQVNVEAVIQAVLLRLKYQLQVGTDEQDIVTKLKPTLKYLKCILDKEHEQEYVSKKVDEMRALHTIDLFMRSE